MKIIEYTDKYKQQVIDLVFDITENEFGHHSTTGRPDVQNVPEFYQKDEESNFWVAVDENDDVAGTIGLKNLNDKCANLRRLYLKKEFRGKGMAKDLLFVLLKFAKEKGHKEIYLSTWEEALAANKFYPKNGFERIPELPKDIAWTAGKDTIFYKLEIK